MEINQFFPDESEKNESEKNEDIEKIIRKEIKELIDNEPELIEEYLKDNKTNCVTSTGSKVIHYFAVAITATLMFLILNSNIFNELFSEYIPNRSYLLIIKSLIMFAVVYVVDLFVENWRTTNVIC